MFRSKYYLISAVISFFISLYFLINILSNYLENIPTQEFGKNLKNTRRIKTNKKEFDCKQSTNIKIYNNITKLNLEKQKRLYEYIRKNYFGPGIYKIDIDIFFSHVEKEDQKEKEVFILQIGCMDADNNKIHEFSEQLKI